MEGKISQARGKKGFTLLRRRGFTLIEVLIDAFILTAIFGVLTGTFIITVRSVGAGKTRVAASALANEQMEKLRNMSYDQLATQHGTILPQGTIPDTQTVTRSGNGFTLTTTVIYVDDPFDGCAIPDGINTYLCTDGGTSSTQDPIPVDYKRITVEVQQTGSSITLAQLTSNAAAKAAETASNTGMLLVVINDALGNPVADAQVVITDTSTGVSITATTNSFGQVFIANVPPDSHNGYHIVATKPGFSSDFTTPRTPQNPNQYQPDVSVNVQQITTQFLSIDKLANMNVTVLNESGVPVVGATITATSSKITQINPETPKNVYNVATSAAGIASFTNIEWDGYTLTINGSYTVLVSAPYQPVTVNPNTTLEAALTVNNQSGWPYITDVNPDAAITNTTVTITINGDNFDSDTTVYLQQDGFPNVTPVSVNPKANKKSVDVQLNLTGVAPGSWDIVVTTSGHTITQTDGLTIS
ncbi:MAG TPA: carboxypeptidase regulatory-like domain-containing protein [Candidatus Saccharimonadales bacterium]|nr:carboxypeptidase regulatory-like domain-containing protein [Candidatus Saccharimonadales bacterium]